MIKINFINIFVILIIFGLSLSLRTYRLDNPVADWHSWRQADTAAVARNFIKEKFDLFYPQSHNYFKQNPSDLDNPNRYFLNEFPFYNAVVALVYKLYGIKESYARLVSAVFASLGTVFLFLLVKKLSSYKIAMLTALFYAVLPYNIYYGRVIMPEPAFICFSVLTLYLTVLWLEKEQWCWACLTSLALGLAMLIKPYAIFLGIPIAYLVLKHYGLGTFRKIQVYFVALISLGLLLLWRYHINQHPEGMFGSEWLINATNIRFKGSFFRWIVFDRMNRLIFASGGFVLFWIGVLAPRTKKESWFFLTWLFSVFAYISYFAMGNVTHDYYQMPIVPVGCYFMAKAVFYLLDTSRGWQDKIFRLNIVLGLVLLMLALGWYEVRGYFNINRWEIVEAGKMVDQLTPKEAKVIAPYNRDPAFLYQTNRNGWSGLRDMSELEDYLKAGATHYVNVDFDSLTHDLMKRCDILYQTDKYVIIDLKTCR